MTNPRKRPYRFHIPALVLLVLLAVGPASAQDAAPSEDQPAAETKPEPNIRNALFVVVDGVYNSELMAPYDVLQHSVFRDENDYIQTWVVSPDGGPVVTFEGITVEAHHSFETAPKVDILVIPSTDGSLDRDLEDEVYMGWVKKAVAEAEWVLTVCDGAFPLAATGVLDDRIATTYPGDRDAFAERFSKVEVRYDVRLVVDGKYITSVGGGMSYEPAFWLVEHLYGEKHVTDTARGLVWPWDSASMPLLVVDRE